MAACSCTGAAVLRTKAHDCFFKNTLCSSIICFYVFICLSWGSTFIACLVWLPSFRLLAFHKWSPMPCLFITYISVIRLIRTMGHQRFAGHTWVSLWKWKLTFEICISFIQQIFTVCLNSSKQASVTGAEPLRGRVEEMSPEVQAGAGLCRRWWEVVCHGIHWAQCWAGKRYDKTVFL